MNTTYSSEKNIVVVTVIGKSLKTPDKVTMKPGQELRSYQVMGIENETHNQTTHCEQILPLFLRDSGLWNPLTFLPFPLCFCNCFISS